MKEEGTNPFKMEKIGRRRLRQQWNRGESYVGPRDTETYLLIQDKNEIFNNRKLNSSKHKKKGEFFDYGVVNPKVRWNPPVKDPV